MRIGPQSGSIASRGRKARRDGFSRRRKIVLRRFYFSGFAFDGASRSRFAYSLVRCGASKIATSIGIERSAGIRGSFGRSFRRAISRSVVNAVIGGTRVGLFSVIIARRSVHYGYPAGSFVDDVSRAAGKIDIIALARTVLGRVAENGRNAYVVKVDFADGLAVADNVRNARAASV